MKKYETSELCENCALFSAGFCFCTGEPEEVIGAITKCSEFIQSSNSIIYDIGFIDGYVKGLKRGVRNDSEKSS